MRAGARHFIPRMTCTDLAPTSAGARHTAAAVTRPRIVGSGPSGQRADDEAAGRV